MYMHICAPFSSLRFRHSGSVVGTVRQVFLHSAPPHPHTRPLLVCWCDHSTLATIALAAIVLVAIALAAIILTGSAHIGSAFAGSRCSNPIVLEPIARSSDFVVRTPSLRPVARVGCPLLKHVSLCSDPIARTPSLGHFGRTMRCGLCIVSKSCVLAATGSRSQTV